MTPENIQSLETHQIFVFGSNVSGSHLGGAAKLAYEKFGALWGVGFGSQGQSYAIATLDTNLEKVPVSSIKAQVSQLFEVARNNPHKEFLVTKIGCGIAGFKEKDIAPLFKGAPDNVILPEGWERSL